VRLEKSWELRVWFSLQQSPSRFPKSASTGAMRSMEGTIDTEVPLINHGRNYVSANSVISLIEMSPRVMQTDPSSLGIQSCASSMDRGQYRIWIGTTLCAVNIQVPLMTNRPSLSGDMTEWLSSPIQMCDIVINQAVIDVCRTSPAMAAETRALYPPRRRASQTQILSRSLSSDPRPKVPPGPH